MAGAGTVVTGTHWGAPLSPGDRVRVLPGGARGRVRAIQVHDRPVERATGGRVALALAGVARAQAPRGACVVGEGDAWEPTGMLDVALTWLPGAGGPLRTRRRLQAFLGTAEVPAACVLLEADSLGPGDSGPVQLRLEHPVVARPGDRVVLRSAERRTVGGGVVGDAHPARRGRRRAVPPASPPPAPPPRPAKAAPPPAGLAAAVAALLSQAGLRPPGTADLAVALSATEEDCDAALAEARAAGAVVEAGGAWFSAEAVAAARSTAIAALAAGPLPLSALRDAWGVGRRHALALAAHLDATGITRRVGDVRVLRRGARPG